MIEPKDYSSKKDCLRMLEQFANKNGTTLKEVLNACLYNCVQNDILDQIDYMRGEK